MEKQSEVTDQLEQQIADVVRDAVKRDLRLWVESPDVWDRLEQERRAKEADRASEDPEEPAEP
ncbi:hypothetical protein P9139_18025 [Curtobacterium flaccumfaciens]|nr:hypothetical protein P9139_18025 [Curtobacterium flaccumfaciens]